MRAELDGEHGSANRCIALRVGSVSYALSLAEVQEILPVRPLTRVFHAPPAIAGVTSLRGEVLPVLDLGVLVGQEPVLSRLPSCIAVIAEPGGRRAGLLVEALLGLRDIGELQPLPAGGSERLRGLSHGVLPEAPPCTLLSAAALLVAPELALGDE